MSGDLWGFPRRIILPAMLHFFKFRQELFAPEPAKEIYLKRGPGKGWPEECPPIRAANAFGFDLLANFDVTFIRDKAGDGMSRRISSSKAILTTPPPSPRRRAADSSNTPGSGKRARNFPT